MPSGGVTTLSTRVHVVLGKACLRAVSTLSSVFMWCLGKHTFRAVSTLSTRVGSPKDVEQCTI